MAEPAALPAEVEALLAAVAAGIGPVLQTAGTRDAARDAALARVAMIQCYRYAPGAPAEILTEAATRMAGHLSAAPPHVSQKSLSSPDGTSLQAIFNNAGASAAFRRSGARVLLSTYRVRRFA